MASDFNEVRCIGNEFRTKIQSMCSFAQLLVFILRSSNDREIIISGKYVSSRTNIQTASSNMLSLNVSSRPKIEKIAVI